MPWTETRLREIPAFEFENWAGIAVCGIPNRSKVGDMGIDGRVYPVNAMPEGPKAGRLAFMDVWCPVQVKQTARVGRPDIDQFEAVMMRERRERGYFVGFEFTADAEREIEAFQRRENRQIVPMRVRDILDGRVTMPIPISVPDTSAVSVMTTEIRRTCLKSRRRRPSA